MKYGHCQTRIPFSIHIRRTLCIRMIDRIPVRHRKGVNQILWRITFSCSYQPDSRCEMTCLHSQITCFISCYTSQYQLVAIIIIIKYRRNIIHFINVRQSSSNHVYDIFGSLSCLFIALGIFVQIICRTSRIQQDSWLQCFTGNSSGTSQVSSSPNGIVTFVFIFQARR